MQLGHLCQKMSEGFSEQRVIWLPIPIESGELIALDAEFTTVFTFSPFVEAILARTRIEIRSGARFVAVLLMVGFGHDHHRSCSRTMSSTFCRSSSVRPKASRRSSVILEWMLSRILATKACTSGCSSGFWRPI